MTQAHICNNHEHSTNSNLTKILFSRRHCLMKKEKKSKSRRKQNTKLWKYYENYLKMNLVLFLLLHDFSYFLKFHLTFFHL